VKRATKRELIVVATMISRMIGTSVFSDRMGFSVATPGRHGSIFAPDYWVRRPCWDGRRWRTLSDVQPRHSGPTQDAKVPKPRQRSALSVTPDHGPSGQNRIVEELPTIRPEHYPNPVSSQWRALVRLPGITSVITTLGSATHQVKSTHFHRCGSYGIPSSVLEFDSQAGYAWDSSKIA
jgi:hypothetical protein